MSRRRQPIDTTLPASATSAALAAVVADVAALDAELTADELDYIVDSVK